MCSVSFVRKERLIRHLKSVHFNLKYHCKECNMKFVEKYKHNYHMVHQHGYSYCAECKVSYPLFKYQRKKSKIKQENQHQCQNYSQFYRCFRDECQGGKVYNRLNFFIRHLQLEHNIDDFEKVKQDIVRSTFEIKKSKKPS